MPSEAPASGSEPGFRSGFVTFVGRPNVGKSTLTNALVGEKVAITSDKPQTTRRAIRGILNRADGQLVIVDTPGIHRPRTLLGERLNHLVEQVLGDVDVIGFCVPATEKVGPGDRRIAESLDGVPSREEGRDSDEDGCRHPASRSPSGSWRSTRCATTGRRSFPSRR